MLYGKSFQIYRERAVSSTPTNLRVTRTGKSAMSKDADEQMLPLMTLTAMAVRAMDGAGIFSIPRNFARATVIHGALIAWAIAGAGMLMLRLVFQTLADRKPKSKETMIFVGSAGIVFV